MQSFQKLFVNHPKNCAHFRSNEQYIRIKTTFLTTLFAILFSGSNTYAKQLSINEALNGWEKSINAGEITPENCSEKFNSIYEGLKVRNGDDFDLSEFKNNGSALVERTVRLRMKAQTLIQSFYKRGTLNDDCIGALRKADLAGRYLTDYIGEITLNTRPELNVLEYYRKQANNSIGIPNPLSGIEPSLVVNPAFEFKDARHGLKSGDVIVSRSVSYTSAGISQLGQEDSQFSHNALVYIDEKSGEIYTIEAFIEYGVIISKLDDYLVNAVARAVVLRFEDEKVAAKAAKSAYFEVKKRKRIKYDNQFNMDDDKSIFCSELVRWAYGPLIKSDIKLPYSMSHYSVEKNKNLFSAFGIHTSILNAPADILYDPRFQIVAEWRDYNLVKSLRLKDFVTKSVFNWLENMNYEIHVPASTSAFVTFGWVVRKIPGLGLLLKDKLSPYAPLKMLKVASAFMAAGDIIESLLVEKMDAFTKEHGRAATPAELTQMIEDIRQADEMKFKENKKSSKFHSILQHSITL